MSFTGRFVIANARLVFPGRETRTGSVLVRDGKIAAIDPRPDEAGADVEQLDARNALVTPGLIDLHCHGVHRWHFDQGAEALCRATEILPQYGVTCVLPTLYTSMRRANLRQLEQLAAALAMAQGAACPGFHLEGPFLALPGAGAETVPGDLGLLREILAAAAGRVTAMSLSPDAPGVLPIIAALVEVGVVPFITHTQASVEQTQAAIDAGARHATHFYDVFPPPPPTDAGVRPAGTVETMLADPRCTVDFICDGVHVHPTAIRAALAAKGWRRVIAITDGNIGAGLQAGQYDTPWGYRVAVRPDDAARIADADHPLRGSLAGSALTMNRALANLLRWLDLPSCQTWAMGTVNPAVVARLAGKGDLAVGCDADLVLWQRRDDVLQPHKTWAAGRCVFDGDADPSLSSQRASD